MTSGFLLEQRCIRSRLSVHAHVGVEYALSGTGLRVTTTATNVGRDACPYGSGAHPYLTSHET